MCIRDRFKPFLGFVQTRNADPLLWLVLGGFLSDSSTDLRLVGLISLGNADAPCSRRQQLKALSLRLRRSKPLQPVSAGDQEFLEWVPGTGTVASMYLRNPALEISAGFHGPSPSPERVLLLMRVSLHRN